ncbi:type II secretion system (T2SS) protein N [Litorimonas taeanensis]|uniref:Type II secretion system protein N n=1 Tax=Litorimonas taeanensis TaxID=568099 RepID=A0A420WMB8_9PROT|nr:type II secretion system (T2SS) protein N [Litorimonas taeanensis]
MRFFLFILAGVVLGLVAFLPLSWVGPMVLPSAFKTNNTAYFGTVWKGGLLNLRDVNTVNYTLKPSALLRGGYPLEIELGAVGVEVSGFAAQNKARNLSMHMNVASLPLPDPRLKGLSGQINARVETVNWDKDGKCKSLSGTAQSDVLTRNRALFQWDGPVLSGPIGCDNAGDYIFNLSGQDDLQSITARISISALGQYKSDINVITRDEDAALVLPLFGFEDRGHKAEGREFSLVEQGQWR